MKQVPGVEVDFTHAVPCFLTFATGFTAQAKKLAVVRVTARTTLVGGDTVARPERSPVG